MTKAWDKSEARFAQLIKLAGDKRTPANVRSNAALAAVKMCYDGVITGVQLERWEAIVSWAEHVEEQVQERREYVGRSDRRYCQHPYNLNGKNGWRCCSCLHFNIMEFERCTCCGHLICGTYDRKKNWTDT